MNADAVRGRLITGAFARQRLAEINGVPAAPPSLAGALDRWWEQAEARLGPASGVRAIADAAAVPLLRILGFEVDRRQYDIDTVILRTSIDGRTGPPVIVAGWGQPLDSLWRSTMLTAIASDVRWAMLFNGTALRIADAHRTWTRDHLEFHLAVLPRDPDARRLLWCTAAASSIDGQPSMLDRLVELSSRHGIEVRRALGSGVVSALETLVGALRGRPRHADDLVFEHSLTVLYRVLFLLFAEARGLVPMWHPVYRDRYSIEALVNLLLAGGRCRGIWHAIQAISRLAHTGCTAGELTVTAFNGRLFSPSQAVAFDRTRIDDRTMGEAILAVSTAPAGGRRRARIAYRDLDVEQLGSVYEQVLEYEPSRAHTSVLTRTRDVRKASGSFYTPRAVTAALVRQTLEPLVRDRSAGDILRLRLVDPAMGSGAFLVAACRYLANAVEDAHVREGTWHRGDITAADRVGLRRDIASRCLYGVDLNPMAVQLARLSLWLATLAADKPLSFLDHHLVTGDSLMGASITDVQRQPSRTRRAATAALPLFADCELDEHLGVAARARLAMALQPDDSAAIVRDKEHALAELRQPGTALGRWWAVLDLWCAGWFWDAEDRPDRTTFGDLGDRLLHGHGSLAAAHAEPLLERAAAIAAERRFLHWSLAFPEVFAADVGEAGGFDAIIGNPPWDMVRGDSGKDDVRHVRQRDARLTADFVRDAGVYKRASHAHVNRYQLFVERALQLLRPGGRLGFVLPSGILGDAGAESLRRELFERADVDTVDGLDNRAGIFPIHRGLRFVLLTCTAGRPTSAIACRFGITRVEDLGAGAATPVVMTRRFIERVSGADDLGVPEIACEADLRLLERISAHVPWLGSERGWHVAFGRELNATDDRGAFRAATSTAWSRPIVEGKHIEPFRVDLERATQELRPDHARGRRIPRRARLAYRDVASARNRVTLIAAIVPPRAVTTHTLFCLRTPVPLDHQQVLCALLNSFVANYLVRFRVNTHVTVALVSRLPVPVLRPPDPAFATLAALAHALAHGTPPAEQMDEYAELQAIVARLYGLDEQDFGHVLSTFPLVDDSIKERCLTAFSGLRT